MTQEITLAELAVVSGGRGGRSVGTGPNTIMELLDKPQKTFDMVRQGLGIPDSGSPGQTYHPATSNPDGSINQGRFSTPSSGPEVPMSR
jgi:hypothetical protein